MDLPVKYHDIPYNERWKVREAYIERQDGACFVCGNDLTDRPTREILAKDIDWWMFPPGFLDHPIHLQHNHETGWTEGVVHAYCNAVLWQYEGR